MEETRPGAEEETTISRVLARELVETAPTLLQEAARIKPKKRDIKRPDASQHVKAQLNPEDRAYSFLRYLNYDGPAPNQYVLKKVEGRISPRFNVSDRPEFERCLTSEFDNQLQVPPTKYFVELPKIQNAHALTPYDRFKVKEEPNDPASPLNLREKFGSGPTHKINASNARSACRVSRVDSDRGPGSYYLRSPLTRRWM